MDRLALLSLAAALALACADTPASFEPELPAPAFAHQSGGEGALTEPAFYDNRLVHFLLPNGGSSTGNTQVVADCFRVGPRVPENVPIRGTVYVLIIPGATHETVCSTDGRDAGELTHNHVFSHAPGDPGYNGKFRIVLVDDTGAYVGPAGKFDSEQDVLQGIADGELQIVISEVARVNWSVQLH